MKAHRRQLSQQDEDCQSKFEKNQKNRLGSEISLPVIQLTSHVCLPSHKACSSAMNIMFVDFVFVVLSSLSNGQKRWGRSFFFLHCPRASVCSVGRVLCWCRVVPLSVLCSAAVLPVRACRQV
jgi:hypothetical protein